MNKRFLTDMLISMLEFHWSRQAFVRSRSGESQKPIDLLDIRRKIEKLKEQVYPSTYDLLVESCAQIQSVLEQGNETRALELMKELEEQLQNIGYRL